ncbi:MAG: bestrophin family ion channel [Nannocystaceae bacterium]
MLVNRRFPPALLIIYTFRVMIVAAVWAAIVFALYAYADFHFLRQPFLPISTIGTAVAFYVGFKNNSAYERFWEGRKIWGGIVNTSRSWATSVLSYVAPGDDGPEAAALRRSLIYRQLAWTNALRMQLRKTSRFFDKPARSTRRRLREHAATMRNDWDAELRPFLDADELAEVTPMVNPATHLLTRQGRALAALVDAKRLDLFHQIAMMEMITELYTLQGKCERIKGTPFPRQYAEYSRLFTRVFIFLVPFGLLDVFGTEAEQATGFFASLAPAVPMIAASSLVSWVFSTMEGIGDSSEDPFERSMNDVPMNAISRTIERDLRQLLGESEIPDPERPAGYVLY